jgi:hypothetical protein
MERMNLGLTKKRSPFRQDRGYHQSIDNNDEEDLVVIFIGLNNNDDTDPWQRWRS